MSYIKDAPITPKSLTAKWRPRIVLICSLTALSCVACLRLDGFRDDLWVDELHTAWVVDGSWSELPARAAIGNQAPLYFCLVKAITDAVGLAENSLRLVSLLAGLGLVFSAWWFVWKQTHDFGCALIALVTVGFDQSCIFYSSEARPYALMQLILVLHLIMVIDNKPSVWQALGRSVCAALGIHLQFTSLLFLAPLYIVRAVLICFDKEADRRRATAAFASEVGLVSLLCAPLVPQVLQLAGRSNAWQTFIPPPSLNGIWLIFVWTPTLIGLAIVFAGLCLRKPIPKASEITKLLFAALAPIALALTLHQLDLAPLFFRRYLLSCIWPLTVLPGLCIANTRGLARFGLSVLIVAIVIFQNGHYAPSRWSAGRLTTQRIERWSDATKRITEFDPKGELPLFIASGFIESRGLKTNPSPLLRDYCRLPVATIYRVPQSEPMIEPLSSVIPADPPELWTQRVLQNGGGIWLLRIRPEAAPKWERLLGQLKLIIEKKNQSSEWTLETHVRPGITIIRLRRSISPSR